MAPAWFARQIRNIRDSLMDRLMIKAFVYTLRHAPLDILRCVHREILDEIKGRLAAEDAARAEREQTPTQ